MSICVMLLLSCVTICLWGLFYLCFVKFNVKKLKTLKFFMCKIDHLEQDRGLFSRSKIFHRFGQEENFRNFLLTFRDSNCCENKSLKQLINILKVVQDTSLKNLFSSFSILFTGSRDLFYFRCDFWNLKTNSWPCQKGIPDDNILTNKIIFDSS